MLETIDLTAAARSARGAGRALATLPAEQKNEALCTLADVLGEREDVVLAANALDVEAARASGLSESLVDRLLLTPARLAGIADDVRTVAALPDPVGEVIESSTLPNGLRLSKRRVPLGVIGVIYESRPNVTIDVSVLCLKSGNAVLLRGGREARRTNAALAQLVHASLEAAGIPRAAVQLLDDPDRRLVGEMIALRGEIDLVIPRGGSGLIEYVRENARVPVVTGGVGVCHTYVHGAADLAMALDIVHNAKMRRTSICNALDTVLVDAAVADWFLPSLAECWAGVVEMRCDPRALSVVGESPGRLPAREDDFGCEFLAARAAVAVVDGLDAAIAHIERYGSGHSEAIVTEDADAAQAFVDRVDAAAVYVNASTQFTDGGQFGMGVEIGISTDRLHARGPMGLRELTTYKWVVLGEGQVRP